MRKRVERLEIKEETDSSASNMLENAKRRRKTRQMIRRGALNEETKENIQE